MGGTVSGGQGCARVRGTVLCPTSPCDCGGGGCEWCAVGAEHHGGMAHGAATTPTTLNTRPAGVRGRAIGVLLLAGVLVGCAGVGVNTAPPPGLTFPESDTQQTETVIRAVDGDTFELSSSGIVRLVGVNSPESVKPGAPVECHGKEASIAAARLSGMTVRLEGDDVAGTYDRYGRRLGYLWYLEDGTWTHYNLEAVANGDARAYAFNNQAYQYREQFEAAEREASARNAGLWACPAGS